MSEREEMGTGQPQAVLLAGLFSIRRLTSMLDDSIDSIRYSCRPNTNMKQHLDDTYMRGGRAGCRLSHRRSKLSVHGPNVCSGPVVPISKQFNPRG